MKRLIIIATALFLSIALFAQDAHLKFKGIPLEGDYKAFARQLVEKDFKVIESSEGGIVLVGNFMARSGTRVYVYPDPSTKVVSIVIALISAGNNWSAIEGWYHNVVQTYKQKYGEPDECIEEFTTSFHDSDPLRLNALRNGECNYNCYWDVEGGRINISLAYTLSDYFVVCTYMDLANFIARQKSILDDI